MNQIKSFVDGPSEREGGPIYLTPAAIQHVKGMLIHQTGQKCFRLSVKHSGCSGLSYVVDYVDNLNPNDLRFSIGTDLTALVDRASFSVLKGICIDYVKKGLNGALKFVNPNQTAACGCGVSFSVDGKIEG